MESVFRSNNAIAITAAGAMCEFEDLWPDEFVRALQAAAPTVWSQRIEASSLQTGDAALNVTTFRVGYISNSNAEDDPSNSPQGRRGIWGLRRTEGTFFMLNRPARSWQMLRLLNGFKAAGRDPNSVPLVILIAQPRPWPETTEAELLELFSPWPLRTVVGINVDSGKGEGISSACERMLELLARARKAPTYQEVMKATADNVKDDAEKEDFGRNTGACDYVARYAENHGGGRQLTVERSDGKPLRTRDGKEWRFHVVNEEVNPDGSRGRVVDYDQKRIFKDRDDFIKSTFDEESAQRAKPSVGF